VCPGIKGYEDRLPRRCSEKIPKTTRQISSGSFALKCVENGQAIKDSFIPFSRKQCFAAVGAIGLVREGVS